MTQHVNRAQILVLDDYVGALTAHALEDTRTIDSYEGVGIE